MIRLTRTLTAPIAAAVTAALASQIPFVGTLPAVGKVAVGAGVAWYARTQDGMLWAAAMGAGVGLAIDGIVELGLVGFKAVA